MPDAVYVTPPPSDDLNLIAKTYLGKKCRDKYSKFAGVASSVAMFSSGCAQLGIQPEIDKDGKLPDSHFFDVQRIEMEQDVEAIPLDNTKTPGFDKTPGRQTNVTPKR